MCPAASGKIIKLNKQEDGIVISRISPLQNGGMMVLALILALVTAAGSPAEEHRAVDPAKAKEAEKADRKKAQDGQESIRVEMAILRVEFDEAHRYGSEIDTGQLEELMATESLQAVARRLEQEGEVSLLHRGQGQTVIGPGGEPGDSRIFIGSETPFISRTTTKEGNENRRTMTQSTVASGATAELEISRPTPSAYLLDYEIDFDEAFPTESEDAPRLIARIRLNWEGDALLATGQPVLIGRFTRDYQNGPAEFVMILQLKAME